MCKLTIFGSRLFFLLQGLPLTSNVRTKLPTPTKPQSRWKVIMIACSTILAIAGCAIFVPAGESNLAPVLNEDAPHVIPGQYIVVFKQGTAREVVLSAQEKIKSLGGRILSTYTSALNGFSVKVPAEARQALRSLPGGVEYIEADRMGKLATSQPPNPPGLPPNGLDRIDQRLMPLDHKYTYSETGLGVHVYVFDSGIRYSHDEFEGRASDGHNFIIDGYGSDDCNGTGSGHGTHMAGTIGGKTYGVAKKVTLHSVKVVICGSGPVLSATISGVDWLTSEAQTHPATTLPAVANMSLEFTSTSPALNLAVSNSIAQGITYVVAAGNDNTDACGISPASVPGAITVGGINTIGFITPEPLISGSNFGSCVDLFAAGESIKSAGNLTDSYSFNASGTSSAAAHVSGVAARYLETHPMATPAQVWSAIHAADNVYQQTASWPGVSGAGTSSPNESLHWGSRNDGQNDGDPHVTTVDGVHYDFQGAGEFVSLRDGNGLQIQTRQTPVSTTFPVANAYTGLATCVSLNTAVATRVNEYRVTFQPGLSGIPNSAGLELRVDGKLVKLPANGLDLGPGGRVISSAGGGIEIDFPDETVLIVTPGWWSSQSKWFLNVDVLRTTAREGVMGALAAGSWLPSLSNGTSLGPQPAALNQRYVDLYQRFADAWRVTDKTSLFDYAKGTSTATFTLSTWPQEKPPCDALESPMAKPIEEGLAKEICRPIVDKNLNANCVFDVAITGEPSFAKTYQLSQQIRAGLTLTTVYADKDHTRTEEPVTFTAIVARGAANGEGVPTGTVQFTLDGERIGEPVKLDSIGRATWKSSGLEAGDHRVAANYIPTTGSIFLASNSLAVLHVVIRAKQ